MPSRRHVDRTVPRQTTIRSEAASVRVAAQAAIALAAEAVLAARVIVADSQARRAARDGRRLVRANVQSGRR